jgi:hypothetical protein
MGTIPVEINQLYRQYSIPRVPFYSLEPKLAINVDYRDRLSIAESYLLIAKLLSQLGKIGPDIFNNENNIFK